MCTIVAAAAAAASDRAGDLGGATLLSSQRSHQHQWCHRISPNNTAPCTCLLTVHTRPRVQSHIDGPEVDEQCAWQENPLPLDEGLGGLCAAAPSTLICLRLPPTWVRFKAAPDAAGELPPRKSSTLKEKLATQGKASHQGNARHSRKS